MKLIKFAVKALDAEKMWDFAQSHNVNFHFLTTIDNINRSYSLYIYEGYMTDETHLMFKLVVPTESAL